MKGLKEIYLFTLKQLLRAKTVKVLTIVIAALLFAVPVIWMTLAETQTGPEAGQEPGSWEPSGPGEESAYSAEGITEVYYTTGEVKTLAGDLFAGGLPGYEKTAFIRTDSETEAKEKAAGRAGALVLVFSETEEGLCIRGIVPERTETDPDKALYLADAVAEALPQLVGAPALKGLELAFKAPGQEAADPAERMRQEIFEILSMVLPYVNIMVIYFLVLYYGQSAANAVILEKTSKLMDTFLVAVKPEAMILGKVLAAWSAALIQVFVWLAALAAGFGAGTLIVKTVNPASTLGIFRAFALLREAAGMFALPAALVALGLLIGGFLLYCCLAAIGASFASKPEELSAAISVFTIILVISMFVVLRQGFMERESAMGPKWFDFFPFTAIMITPSRILLGYITPLYGLISLAITLLLSLLAVGLAGRVYRAMSLYKGNFPKLKDIPGILKG